MPDKFIYLDDCGSLVAVARWNPDPACPGRPDPILMLHWTAQDPWYYMAVLMDRLLNEYSRLPGIIFEESLLLGRARFGTGSTELAIEVTGQAFEEQDRWPISRFIAHIHGIYPDKRFSLFEPESLPFRVYASATDAYNDHTCSLHIDFDEADEVLSLPSVGKWLVDHKLVSEDQVTALLGNIRSEAAEHFDDSGPESGVESDLGPEDGEGAEPESEKTEADSEDDSKPAKPAVRRPPTF
jgi:hypothetical protein